MVVERVMIERRYCRPPNSAQGGYTCGLVAERLAGDCAMVAFGLPPPLERPLDLCRRNDGIAVLLDGERLLAEGARADLRLGSHSGTREPYATGCGSRSRAAIRSRSRKNSA